MKKTIDKMSRLLEHNDISLPEGAKKVDARNKVQYHERCHAMKVGFSK